jgi:hypothetical protein
MTSYFISEIEIRVFGGQEISGWKEDTVAVLPQGKQERVEFNRILIGNEDELRCIELLSALDLAIELIDKEGEGLLGFRLTPERDEFFPRGALE